MKIIVVLLAIITVIASCDKENPAVPPRETHPEMSYIDLARGVEAGFAPLPAIQLNKIDHLYNGWVEVSFSTSEESLILRKIAVSLEPNKKIIAGKLN